MIIICDYATPPHRNQRMKLELDQLCSNPISASEVYFSAQREKDFCERLAKTKILAAVSGSVSSLGVFSGSAVAQLPKPVKSFLASASQAKN